MCKFTFTVDDNIRFLKDLTYGSYDSIFDHPYMAMYQRLHNRFGLKLQLNLFYRCDGFDLSVMTDKYRSEWEKNADWIRLSFHSDVENVDPYIKSGYSEVFRHCAAVNKEIKRFAGEGALAITTTLHYCQATKDGLHALYDNGVRGLLGLFGTDDAPFTSYDIREEDARVLRHGGEIWREGIAFRSIDLVLNNYSNTENLCRLSALVGRKRIGLMIHEQYFYEDYRGYQQDFEDKLASAFEFMNASGYRAVFFEDDILP